MSHNPELAGHAQPQALLHAARALTSELAREAALRDRTRQLPHAEVALIRKAGITAARIPASHAGAETNYRTLTEIFIALARGDSNIAQLLIPHFTSLERIRLMGTADQKAFYFTRILAGEIIGGATSERGGRFRTDIATLLTPDGDGYRLNGDKFYSTASLLSGYLRITAATENGEKASVIIPRDRDGVHLHDDWSGMGQRTTASGSSTYRNVRVEAAEVIPFGPWDAQYRNYGSAASQLLHASIAAGIAFAALDDAIQWARNKARPVKESGVQRATDDPYVQQTIGQIAAQAHAAEAALLRAAEFVDQAAQLWHANPGTISSDSVQQACITASIAVAEARIATHHAGLKAAEQLYEVAGAAATLEENGFDRHWRNARTHTTHDPVAYKYKAIGNYLLNGEAPPLSLYY